MGSDTRRPSYVSLVLPDATHLIHSFYTADEGANKPGEIHDIPDIDGHTNELTKDMNALSVEQAAPDLDDIPDMEEEGLEEEADEATVKPTPAPPVEIAKGNLLQVRTYDVMITYDKYYQTPRIWLLGFDEVCSFSFLR